MAEKEYIAGDPSDIQNVYRTLKDISILQTTNSKVGKEIKNIYKSLEDSLVNQTDAQKNLFKINVTIQDQIAKIKSLEDRKLKGLISQKFAQEELVKQYKKINVLLNNQKSAEEALTVEKSKQGKGQQFIDLLSKSLFNGQSKYLSGLQSILQVWGETASIVLVLYELGKQIFEVFEKLDESAMEFRKEMGFTRKFTAEIDNYARDAATSLAKLGVTGKEAYAAIVGISKELYSSMSVAFILVRNISLLSAQLGISEASSAELLKNLGIVSRTTASMQMNTVLFASGLSEAAGTSLKDVMADISNATKTMYQFVSRSSLELVKAAVESRRMGTTIESSTKSASSLLNFTESIKTEMEASVLLGKSINLQKARELAYHRDIRGLNKEILNIVKETDFENLDSFQQDAVARALGKSAYELANMAQAERERLNIERAMTPEQRKQHQIYQDMLSASSKQAKNYAKIAEETLLAEGNQSRALNISKSWHAIISKLAVKLLPIIDTVMKFIADHFDTILGTSMLFFTSLKLIVDVFRFISTSVFDIGASIKDLGAARNWKWIKKIGSAIEEVAFKFRGIGIPKFFNIFDKIGNVAGKLFKFLAPLMLAFNIFKEIKKILNDKKFMGGDEDWMIFYGHTVVRALGAIARAIWTTIDDFFFGLPGKLVNGIKSVGEYIFGALLDPFKRAWHWLGETFLGNSPSQLGLMIVDGIMAVEGMLIKALISPFQKAWEFIKTLPIVSHLFGNNSFDSNIQPDTQSEVTVDRPFTPTESNQSKSSLSTAMDTMNDELSKQLSAVVDAINGLRDDMRNGSITSTVFLDSQKLDTAIGRRLSYTGTST